VSTDRSVPGRLDQAHVGVPCCGTVIGRAGGCVPLAFYMAKVASPAMRVALVVAVTTPLWASSTGEGVRWRVMLSPEGPLDVGHRSTAPETALPPPSSRDYIWLPYMVIQCSRRSNGCSSLSKRSATQRRIGLLDAACGDGTVGLSGHRRRSISPSRFVPRRDYIAVPMSVAKTQLSANIISGQLVTANNQPGR